MSIVRYGTLATILLTIPSLFQKIIPLHSISWLLMDPNTAFGLIVSECSWFAYFSRYKYAGIVLFIQGVISLPLSLFIILGYFIHHQLPIAEWFTPKENADFMLNLAIAFSAYYLVQILYRWIPKTTSYINGLLAIILFVALLSISGHVYNLENLVTTQLLMPIPTPAIIAFVILAVCISIEVNRMERLYLSRSILGSFMLMLVAVIGANIVVYHNFNATVATANKIDSIRHTLSEVYDLDFYMDTTTSAAQSYESTGDAKYVADYQKNKHAYKNILSHIKTEAARTNNDDLTKSVHELDMLGVQALAVTDSIIDKKPSKHTAPTSRTTDIVLDEYMDKMLDGVRDATSAYTQELDGLVVQEAYGGRGIVTGTSISSALTILLILFTPLFIRQTIRKVSLTQEKLAKTNHQLAEEKSRVEAILSSIGDGIFAVDQTCHITMFNPAAESITGFTVKALLNQRFEEKLHFIADNGDEKLLEFIQDALKGKEVQISHNISLKHSKGHMIEVQLSASPVRDRSGTVTAAIVVFRDRTQEQALENAKDEFVSLASHQLRTPATATKQFLAMFLQGYAGDITDKQRLFLQEAYNNNELGINIIEELLNIARLESNQTKMQKELVDAHKLMQQAADIHADLLKKSHQTLQLNTPKEPVSLYADPNMLTMVLDNLITNASKYTLEGGKITLDLSQTTQSVRITVSDTGIGIKKEDVPKIFGRFSRLEDPSKQHVSGTGIGLYLVQKIIDMHHATITVESQYGKGTSFILTFKKAEE